MASILIVSGNAEKARLVASYLAQGGHSPAVVPDAAQAVASLEERPAQAVLVDVEGKADGSSEGLLTRLRGASRAPIVVLMDQADLSRYEPATGIDDFVAWPCRPEELLARVRHVLRRAGVADTKGLIRVGELSIDPEQYKVWVAGVPATLTYTEFELLRLLATSPGRVLSREKLLSQIWGYDYFGGDRTVDVHIRRLRSKIEAWGHSFIETVRNVGYRFREQA